MKPAQCPSPKRENSGKDCTPGMATAISLSMRMTIKTIRPARA